MLKWMRRILVAGLSFFAITFVIYLFNLDMKAAAAATPWMNRFYDYRKKKMQESKK